MTLELKPLSLNVILETFKQNTLLVETVNLPVEENITISYPRTDTRELQSFSDSAPALQSFICIRGYTTDGHQYAEKAIEKGAGLIIAEKSFPHLPLPQIIVSNSRRALALIAKLFFSDPSKKFYLIGVTGTNGKTSTVKIIEHILRKEKVASIGTLGYTINGVEYPLERTTPDITELHQILHKFVEEKVKFVVMEVSSHALKLDRVYGLHFDCALFTNLSREHLDFHPDMEDYYQSKALLFDYAAENGGAALINVDDRYGKRLYQNYNGEKYSLKLRKYKPEANNKNIIMNSSDITGIQQSNEVHSEEADADIFYSIIKKDFDSTLINISLRMSNHSRLEKTYETALLGGHNAFNTTAAIIVAGIAQLKSNGTGNRMERIFTNREDKWRNIIDSSELPVAVRGRLESVKLKLTDQSESNIRCFIDYAHSPDALELSCKTLKEIIDSFSNAHYFKNAEYDAAKTELNIKKITTHSPPPKRLNPPRTRSHALPGNAFLGGFNKPRLICVFGAGGNRDKGKRREMTDAVLKYADLAIITNDNPREENPTEIIFDLIQHLHPLLPYWIVSNRKEAIRTGVKIAGTNDIILIAGKGHENYQIIGGTKYHFDDLEEVKEALKEKLSSDHKTIESTGSASEPTTLLEVPLDLVQVQLLLGYCRKEDLKTNRWQDDKPVLSENLIKTIRDSVISHTVSLSEINGVTPLKNPVFHYVSTDTRSIKDYSLFIALRGENFDGHNFVTDALKYPHNYAVVNNSFNLSDELDFESKKSMESRLIRVDDTTIALALSAKKYKTLFNSCSIALTGSTGKTSTKEYCYNVLSREAPTLKNLANENNIIGLSRTLLSLKAKYRYLVLELGTNHKGEMQVLADTADPDIGIINNIGPCHLEAFGDLEGVYQEKITLLDRDLTYRIIPGDDKLFAEFDLPVIRLNRKAQSDGRVQFVAEENCNLEEKNDTRTVSENNESQTNITPIGGGSHSEDILQSNNCNCEYCFNIDTNQTETVYPFASVNVTNYHLPTDVPFLAHNAAYALTVGWLSGLNPETIQKGLLESIMLNDRMEKIIEKDRVILSDCYNANPHSMKEAIRYWSRLYPDKIHLAVLGDMLELGDKSEKYHQEIGDIYQQETVNKPYKSILITVGDNARYFRGDHHFNNVRDLMNWRNYHSLLQISDSITLIKASHGIHLEKIKGR